MMVIFSNGKKFDQDTDVLSGNLRPAIDKICQALPKH